RQRRDDSLIGLVRRRRRARGRRTRRRRNTRSGIRWGIAVSHGSPPRAMNGIEKMAPAACAAHSSILGSRAKPVKDELTHVFYDRFAEFAALYLARTRHHPREIVGHGLGVDRAFHALDDEIRRLVPLHVTQHHLA